MSGFAPVRVDTVFGPGFSALCLRYNAPKRLTYRKMQSKPDASKWRSLKAASYSRDVNTSSSDNNKGTLHIMSYC